MSDLTRGILVANEVEARRKPSGFKGLMPKMAGKRAALPSSSISGVEILKTLSRPGECPPIAKTLNLQRQKCHQIIHINES
jgi:hypothetical protein